MKKPKREKERENAKLAILLPNPLPSIKPPNKPVMVNTEISIAKGRAFKKILVLNFSFIFPNSPSSFLFCILHFAFTLCAIISSSRA